MDDRTRILLRRASFHRAALGAAPESGPAVAARPQRSEAAGVHARPPARVLALVDMTGRDRRIVEAARTLAGSDHATIVLLHVARPVFRNGATGSGAWERMAAVESGAQQALRRLAARLLPPSVFVQTAVRFGDPVEQAAKAAVAVDATVVVALSRPARWLWWRSRDRRLRRILDIPTILVHPRRAGAVDLAPRRSTASRRWSSAEMGSAPDKSRRSA